MGKQKLVDEDIINQLIRLINPKDDSVYEYLMCLLVLHHCPNGVALYE